MLLGWLQLKLCICLWEREPLEYPNRRGPKGRRELSLGYCPVSPPVLKTPRQHLAFSFCLLPSYLCLSLYLPDSETRRKPASLLLLKIRAARLAGIRSERTTGMESASARWIHRRRGITVKDDSPACPLDLRIRNRDSRNQCASIRMKGLLDNSSSRSQFNDTTQVHHRDSVRDEFYNQIGRAHV